MNLVPRTLTQTLVVILKIFCFEKAECQETDINNIPYSHCPPCRLCRGYYVDFVAWDPL